MLAMLVRDSLTAFDRVIFDSRDTCPACGGLLSGYDTRERRFATISEGGEKRVITVRIRRFFCRSCRTTCHADEPFYPGTRIGSLVIDLCTVLSSQMGYGRAARNLSAMGVAITRMQCRHYAGTTAAHIPVISVFGLSVPQSVISVSALAAALAEGSCIERAEALAACGFPSAQRAALHVALPRKERDQRDEQKGNKERDTRHPENERERK